MTKQTTIVIGSLRINRLLRFVVPRFLSLIRQMTETRLISMSLRAFFVAAVKRLPLLHFRIWICLLLLAFSYLLAEKISCSVELSTKNSFITSGPMGLRHNRPVSLNTAPPPPSPGTHTPMYRIKVYLHEMTPKYSSTWNYHTRHQFFVKRRND